MHAHKQSRKPPKPEKPEKAKAPGGGGRSVQGIPVEAPEIGDSAMYGPYLFRLSPVLSRLTLSISKMIVKATGIEVCVFLLWLKL